MLHSHHTSIIVVLSSLNGAICRADASQHTVTLMCKIHGLNGDASVRYKPNRQARRLLSSHMPRVCCSLLVDCMRRAKCICSSPIGNSPSAPAAM